MFIREQEVKGRTDVSYYTARRLGDMTESLNQLARMSDDGIEKNRQLAKDSGLTAMQASTALVCDNCSRYNLYADSGKEGSYYLYYLLQALEQKGHIDFEDMPQMFQSGYRKEEDYLAQLNRSLGRATMNLFWKNRFLESRDTVISQSRELSVILEESFHQIDRAGNITDGYGYILKEYFKRYHVALDNLLLLEYENGQKEALLTARTTDGRYIASKDAVLVMGEVMDGTRWNPARDSRNIIIKQYETVRFLEKGEYRVLYGVSRIPKKGEKYSGNNYTFRESPGNRVVISLSDGMGGGEMAARESRQVVELAEQLLETEFSPRAALKLVNAVFLLADPERHPATLDLNYIDLHTGILEVMKLGTMPTFIIGEKGVEIMEAGEVPMGILSRVEPVLMFRKPWEGDQIVMVSDGVLDALPRGDKEQAMQQYLENVEEIGPQELVDQVLDFAVSFIPASRDDVTVLTAGIWKRRSQFTMIDLRGGMFADIL